MRGKADLSRKPIVTSHERHDRPEPASQIPSTIGHSQRRPPPASVGDRAVANAEGRLRRLHLPLRASASTLDSPTRSAYAQVELAFTLELEPANPTTLLRTLVLLHRRCCSVTEADYRSRPDGYDRLDLRLQAPTAHAHSVAAWLSALVDVRRVIALPRQGQPDGVHQRGATTMRRGAHSL